MTLMEDTAGMLGVFGFIALPLLLVGLVLVELAISFRGRTKIRKVLAALDRARDDLRTESNVSQAEFEASTLSSLMTTPWVRTPVRSIALQFTRAASLALHSESHRRDLSTDPGYLGKAADLFACAHSAIDMGDLFQLAGAAGDLYVLDALDRVESSDITQDDVPEDIRRKANRPLLLVGNTLEDAAGALEAQDVDRAKIIIDRALDYTPLAIAEDQLGIVLLTLYWARTYLHHVSDVRSSGHWMFWKDPEDVVVTVLRKAATAARRSDLHLLIITIARSKGAYRTPRI